MHTRKRGVVRRHAVILQAGNRVHTLLGHVLLGEHDGQFLGTVIAVVEENDHVAFLDGTVDGRVVDGLHELVGHALVIAFLHGLHHVCSLMSLAADEQVVSYLDTFPALVAVHGIEAAHDAGYGSARHLGTLVGHLLDESLATLGVRVATVHEAVDIGMGDAILARDFYQLEEVLEAAVYAAVTGQSHQVDVLAVYLGILVCRHHFGVLHDAAIGTGAVDLHQVLIHNTSGTDVEVSHLRVAHLSVGQSHVLAACEELRAGIGAL